MAYLKLDSSSASSSSSSSSSCKPCSPGTSEPSSSAEPLMAASHKRKAGRKKFKETRHPVFRGVRQRQGDKWVCEVREPKKKSRIWLGTFVSPEMAARAYDVAALVLRGNSAVLNFPDSASILPKAKSSSPKDIQMAALAAAEAFKPTTCSSPSSDNIDQRRGNEVLGQHSSTMVHCENLEAEANELNNPLVIDEEALFNMPGLLDSMAEGMLLTPPALQREVDWDNNDDTIKIDLWGDY